MVLDVNLVSSSLFIMVWGAAAWDIYERRVPNCLVFGGAIVGTSLHLGLAGLDGFLEALAGLTVGFGLLIPGYLMGTTGAGDVKLMAAIGAFLGPYAIFFAGLTSLAVGGMVALSFMVLSAFSSSSQSPWQRYGLMCKTLFVTGRPVYVKPAEGEVMGRKFPFAVSIALGTTLFLIWQSPLIRQIT